MGGKAFLKVSGNRDNHRKQKKSFYEVYLIHSVTEDNIATMKQENIKDHINQRT